MEKVILTTGGTGGHIFPALAVAEELRDRYPGIQLLFMGSFYGPEEKLAREWNIPFKGFNVRGFLGRGMRAAPAALNMMKAIVEAGIAIAGFKPDIVAGFGGYASFAPMLSACGLRKATLLHEQNAIAGSGNRFLGKLVDKVCVSLPGTAGFNSETIVTGNPVRKTFQEVENRRQKKGAAGKNILVLGGSQGAHALNQFVCKNLRRFRDAGITVMHQTGEKDFENCRKAYQGLGMETSLLNPFIKDMASAYTWADLAICRAGASTIAELCACGLPAVFVPFPQAIHDHQTKNAKAVEDGGGAIVINEKSLDKDDALNEIIQLLDQRGRLDAMGRATKKIARTNAAAKLVDAMESLVDKGKGLHAKQN